MQVGEGPGFWTLCFPCLLSLLGKQEKLFEVLRECLVAQKSEDLDPDKTLGVFTEGDVVDV